MSALPQRALPAVAPVSAPVPVPVPASYPLGYLRAFVTLLVLAHHAILAYHPLAPTPTPSLRTEPRAWWGFPVVDPQHSVAGALFVGWTSAFFMSLMFFLSGLFVSGSLGRKGLGPYLRDRLRRLGLPFLFGGAVIAPLSYYPAYLATDATDGVAGFVREWLALGNWPTGPAWFLLVLLVFDALAAGAAELWPGWDGRLADRASGLLGRPTVCFGLLVAAAAAIYLPFMLTFGPVHWTRFGPVMFQTSRVPHYALYFAVGLVTGARGVAHGLLAQDGPLARRWPRWVLFGAVVYLVAVVAIVAAKSDEGNRAWQAARGLGFVMSSAASSFALLAVFLRFFRRRNALGEGLRDNAYGMFLFHYPVCTWLQYALIDVRLPAVAKAALVFSGSLAASYAGSAAVRRVDAVRRVL